MLVGLSRERGRGWGGSDQAETSWSSSCRLRRVNSVVVQNPKRFTCNLGDLAEAARKYGSTSDRQPSYGEQRGDASAALRVGRDGQRVGVELAALDGMDLGVVRLLREHLEPTVSARPECDVMHVKDLVAEAMVSDDVVAATSRPTRPRRDRLRRFHVSRAWTARLAPCVAQPLAQR